MMTETHMRQYIPVCDNAETLAGAETGVRRCSDALGAKPFIGASLTGVYLLQACILQACTSYRRISYGRACLTGVYLAGVWL
jgi:hypothetical protein